MQIGQVIIGVLALFSLFMLFLIYKRKDGGDVSLYEKQITDLKERLAFKEKESLENHTARIQAEAALKAEEDKLISEKKTLDEAKAKLNDAFKGLASNALEGNTKHFLSLAREYFEKHTETAKGDLSKRQESINGLVNPLKETLEKYQAHLKEIEKERQKSYTSIELELKKVIETGSSLSSETRALKNALKKPHIRGRWGEIQLKNCVELAGMSEFCDFTLQDANKDGDGQLLIPDLTVKMPGERLVIVDSKAPLDAFLDALEANTDEERATETARHARQVKGHIKKLSTKAYSDNVGKSADFTVMFLPNESFLYAALEVEADLVEYALQKKILVATPPTFVGLLKVIRYGWNEKKLAQNAVEISEVGKELHKRVVDFVDGFMKIGKKITEAKDEYDIGMSRLNSRVIVQARKMEALGAKGKKDLPENLGHVPELTGDKSE